MALSHERSIFLNSREIVKNKGRKHLGTTLDCKGWLMGITRPIRQMGRRKKLYGESFSNKWLQKKWNKRMRGYLKSQTKEI